MAKINFPGLEKYQEQIAKLGASSEDIIKKAVYEGAGIVADQVKQNLAALPTISDNEALAAYQQRTPSRISTRQKTGLINSFGLAKMRNDGGYINTKIGFDGYNSIRTKKYPNGQPNALIARSAESGSTATLKSPFVRPGVSKAKAEAERAMEKKLDEEIKKIMK